MKLTHVLAVICSFSLLMAGCFQSSEGNSNSPPPSQEGPSANKPAEKPPEAKKPSDSPPAEPEQPIAKPKPPSSNPPAKHPPRRPSPRHQIIDDVFPLAKKGQVLYSRPFSIGSRTDDIKKAWGEPSWSDDYVLHYKKRGMIFSSDDSGKVNSITLTHKDLNQYTLREVKSELGRPQKEYNTEGFRMLMYEVGDYSIFLEFNMPDNKNPNPKWRAYYIIKKSEVRLPS